MNLILNWVLCAIDFNMMFILKVQNIELCNLVVYSRELE